MKIIVSVKRVVDADARIRVRADGSGLDLEHLRRSMNPFDEIALEEAVRLKEAGRASSILVVSAGTAEAGETLRTALALGADRALLIETESELQPLAVAKLQRALCLREGPALVLCGKQAIDEDAGQTGPMLAALLGWPQATFVSALKLADGRLHAIREIDGGRETLDLPLPAVVTVDLRLNTPRYASLPNIVKAKRRPIETLSPAELDVDTAPRLRTLNVAEPPRRPPGVRLADAAELVERLKQDGVI